MSSPKLILVVDDDGNIRALLRRVIEHKGHRVLDAANATAAIDVLARHKVDLVLCDVRMPGHDGVWLVDQIVTRFPGVPVALATGVTEMDPRVTLRPGVIGYLTKPFELKPLVALIEQLDEQPPAAPRPRQGELADEDLDRLLDPDADGKDST